MRREGRNKAIQADGQCSLFQMQVFLCVILDFRETKKVQKLGGKAEKKNIRIILSAVLMKNIARSVGKPKRF